jgi:hypothetical protein
MYTPSTAGGRASKTALPCGLANKGLIFGQSRGTDGAA